jgi:hypothetical protein
MLSNLKSQISNPAPFISEVWRTAILAELKRYIVQTLAQPFDPNAALQAAAGAARHCSERACIFPALRGDYLCGYHRLMTAEPGCFESSQPISAVMDQAIYNLPEVEADENRGARRRERLRLAAERIAVAEADQ